MKIQTKIKKLLKTGMLILVISLSGITPILADNTNPKITDINLLDGEIASNKYMQPFIVRFGNSFEENVAIAELIVNFPESKIVDFNTLSVDSLIDQTSPIIWVGHGNNEGIKYLDNIISWANIKKLINLSNSNYHFFLSCNSDLIAEYNLISDVTVIGFDSKIDAIWGANIISIYITKLFGHGDFNAFFAKAMERSLISPESHEYIPLGWSSAEAFTRLALILITVSSLVFLTYSIALAPFASAIAWEFAQISVWMYFAIATFDLLMGPTWNKAADFFTALSTVIPLFAQFIIAKYGLLQGALINTAGYAEYAVTAAKIAIFVAAIGMAISNLQNQVEYMTHDKNDCNNLPAEIDNGYTGCAPAPGPPIQYE